MLKICFQLRDESIKIPKYLMHSFSTRAFLLILMVTFCWFDAQAEITKAKIVERHQKAIHRGNYVHTLLSKCKQHGEPFISEDELDTSPELYKVNPLSTSEMKVNLAVLLTDDHNSDLTNDKRQFPNETAMINVIKRSNEEVHDFATINEYPIPIPINEPYVVIWDTVHGREWYIGIVRIQIDTEHYSLNHLERVPRLN